eukprot:1394232-Amorphochlora_amoeboformis.AAC.1
MPLYTLFYLILAYATPLAALPSPVERADKIIFSRGINFALENATKAGKYGQRKEERSFWKKRIARLEGMTTAHCANFQGLWHLTKPFHGWLRRNLCLEYGTG